MNWNIHYYIRKLEGNPVHIEWSGMFRGRCQDYEQRPEAPGMKAIRVLPGLPAEKI